jgi:hypothetical protein
VSADVVYDVRWDGNARSTTATSAPTTANAASAVSAGLTLRLLAIEQAHVGAVSLLALSLARGFGM